MSSGILDWHVEKLLNWTQARSNTSATDDMMRCRKNSAESVPFLVTWFLITSSKTQLSRKWNAQQDDGIRSSSDIFLKIYSKWITVPCKQPYKNGPTSGRNVFTCSKRSINNNLIKLQMIINYTLINHIYISGYCKFF